jgi:hypothetical protein
MELVLCCRVANPHCIDRNRHRGKSMKKNFAAVLFFAAMIAAQSAWAEDKIADVTDMQALRAAVRADKKAFVASTLKLTPAEAKRFWPVYDNYQRILDSVNQRRVVAVEALVALDKPITDLYARNLANELVATDEVEIKARRTLHNRLMRGVPTRILPPKKAARYLQLESKIRAVLAYDIAATIPLVK